MKKELAYKEDGQDKVLFVIKPTAKHLQDAQIYSSRIFAKLINDEEDGKPTALVRAKLMEYMYKVGLWDEQKEKELTDIQKQIIDKEKVFFRGGVKLSEAKKNAHDIKRLRARQYELLAKKTELDAKTAEGSAENARFDYLASVCILKDDGTKFFPSVEEYLENNHKEYIYRAAMMLAESMGSADSKWEEKLPENKFLKEYGFVDEKLRLINKDKHLVDEDGRLINEDGRYVAYENGSQYFVDREGNKVDKEGNPVLEFTPFLED